MTMLHLLLLNHIKKGGYTMKKYLLVLFLLFALTPLNAENQIQERHQSYINHLKTLLSLNSTQVNQIQDFLAETRKKVTEINEDPYLDQTSKIQRTKAVFRESKLHVRSILDREQLAKYDEYQRDQWQRRGSDYNKSSGPKNNSSQP